MARLLLQLAGVNGFLAVALGAFGAHGLQSYLEGQVDGALRLEWWETAAHYHLIHALAFVACAWIAERTAGRLAVFGGWCFQLGILLFSGSLYVMCLTDLRVLGAVTPIGGVLLLGGWALVVAGARASER